MGDKHDGLVSEHAADALLEDVFPNVGVHGAQRVVKEIDVAVGVHRPRQADSLLLAPAQVDAPLTNLDKGR